VTPKLYKAVEVCEMTGLQPYVLRSWEKEFPGIGVQKSPESARLYRQSDLDQVRRIKQLVLGEGLTLAGARRRLEETSPGAAAGTRAVADDEVLDVLGANARARISAVRSGLRALLDTLSKAPGGAPLAAAQEHRANGSAAARADRKGGSGSDRRRAPASEREGRSGASKRKAAVAAKRSAPTKRAVGRKPTRSKRKRASA
jgi:DNA-binding transcriptional MerR regulator